MGFTAAFNVAVNPFVFRKEKYYEGFVCWRCRFGRG